MSEMYYNVGVYYLSGYDIQMAGYSPADLWQKGSVSDKSTKICILIVYYILKDISSISIFSEVAAIFQYSRQIC